MKNKQTVDELMAEISYIKHQQMCDEHPGYEKVLLAIELKSVISRLRLLLRYSPAEITQWLKARGYDIDLKNVKGVLNHEEIYKD